MKKFVIIIKHLFFKLFHQKNYSFLYNLLFVLVCNISTDNMTSSNYGIMDEYNNQC